MNHAVKRITTLVLTLALTMTALAQGDAAANDAAASDSEEAAAQEPAFPSIAAAIREDPELTTLARLFEDTGLLAQLEEATRLTFFAPSNAAFERIGEEAVAELFRDRGSLDVIMRHHLVFGASPLNAMRRLDALTTLEGTRLRVDARGDGVTIEGVPVDDGRRVGNGVLYVIDQVLLPQAGSMIKDLLSGPVR